MVDEDLSGAIEVESVQDQFRHVHRCACACGGHFSAAAGLMGHEAASPVIRIETDPATGRALKIVQAACVQCGAGRRFVFALASEDVSKDVVPSKDRPGSMRANAKETAGFVGLGIVAYGMSGTLTGFVSMMFLVLAFCCGVVATVGVLTIIGEVVGPVEYEPRDGYILLHGLALDSPEYRMLGAMEALGLPDGSPPIPFDRALLADEGMIRLSDAWDHLERFECRVAREKAAAFASTAGTGSPRDRRLAAAALVLVGIACRVEEREPEAAAAFRAALELDPSNPRARDHAAPD